MSIEFRFQTENFLRFKWVCPKSVRIPKTGTRRCICDKPCTDSSYGKCVYTYPDKDFRLYPGIPRDTEHWKHIYSNRITVERTINLLKDTFALADNKSYSVITLKADLFLSGIVQLIGVILADKLNKHHLFQTLSTRLCKRSHKIYESQPCPQSKSSIPRITPQFG